MFRTKTILFILGIVFSAPIQSQLNWGIEIKPKFGFIIADRGVVGYLPRSHSFGGEVSFVVFTNGKKKWHSVYNYPTVGFTIFGASVGNRKVLGNFFGSYAFIEFPFFKIKKYSFTGKLGSGLAYGTKVYDPLSNPKNAVISTPINALVCLGFKNRFVVNNHQFVLGIDLTHCSNGAFKVPNIGINMPFVSLGYGYRFKTTLKDTIERKNLPFRKILFGTTAILSAKEIFPIGQGRSPVYSLSTFARYFFKPKVGCEISLDVTSKQVLFKYKPVIQKNQLDVIQVGLYAGYLLPLDNFQLVIGMGINVRDKYRPESLLYHRVGMRYYFNNGVHLNTVLRSNWAKADFTEWGIGYTFNYKKK